MSEPDNELLSEVARLRDDVTQLRDVTARAETDQNIWKTACRLELRRLHEDLQRSKSQSIRVCSELIKTFDPLLGSQARAVVAICTRMAKSQYFTDGSREALTAAAWLHDIGLIGVDRRVLRKLYNAPHSLSSKEEQLIHQHPIKGQQLASFCDPLIGEIIRAHHERFDGSGYPDQLAGEMIPWPARALAVAVYFVESGLRKHDALNAILEQSGKAFDPQAVRLFFKSTQSDTLPHQVREVMLDEIQPGMCLAKGLYTDSGMLLVPRGTTLTNTVVAKIRNYSVVNAVNQRVLVFI